MLITPGPLVIVPTEKATGYWLRIPPGSRGHAGSAVATVWSFPPHRDTASGNAAVMAFASELYELVSMMSLVKDAAQAGVVKREAKALLQRIEEAAP